MGNTPATPDMASVDREKEQTAVPSSSSDSAPARTARRYSLRDLLTFTAAVAVGFAVAKVPEFGVVDGLFATASLLVIVGLVTEIRFIRNQQVTADADRFSRSFHIGWRVMLVVAVLFHYVTGTVRSVHALMKLDLASLDLLESLVAPSMVLLQLAVFSSLTLDFLPRRVSKKSPARRQWLAGIAIVVLALVVLVGNYMVVVMLVQVAVEAMELGLPSDVYRPGSPYFGIDPNVRRRIQHFAIMSLAGFLSLLFLLAAVHVAVRRLQRRQPLGRAAIALVGFLVIAAAYPIWAYAGGGLRRFSPPFAEASLQLSWTSTLAAALSVTLLTTLLTYRFLATTPDHASTIGHWPMFTHYRPTTMFAVAVASLGWVSLSWETLWGPAWEFVLAPLTEPARYVSIATVCVVLSRLTDSWRSERLTGSPPATLDRTACAITWPAIAMTIIVGVPTLLWSAYSVLNVCVRS